MTCEVLPPALTTRRARAASRIASAGSVLRHGGRDAEIVLLDGTTRTAAEFSKEVAFALRHNGLVGPEDQRYIDDILAVAGERDPLEWVAPRPPDCEDNVGRTIAAYGAIALIFSLILLALLGFGRHVEARTTTTLQQATQAEFREWSE